MWSSIFTMTSLLVLDGVKITAFSYPITNQITRPFQYNKNAMFAESPTKVTDAVEILQTLYNAQITREFEASQLYLSASIWCDQQELVGMGAYMRQEADEERGHALQFIDFGMKRSLPLSLGTVGAPSRSWDTPEDLWTDVLNCEKRNSESIGRLADSALTCKDHSIAAFLQPFHLEQVHSMDKLSTILAKVKDENQTPGLLRQLDSELGGEAV